MGVPVVSQPGEGYSLMAGYFLPPLVFTADEAAALFLGAKLLASQATGRIVGHAEQGLAKIAHILPAETRRSVEQITQETDHDPVNRPRSSPLPAAAGVTVDQMAQTAHGIQTWLREQPGYLDRTLAKDDTGLWLDVVSWTSLAEAQRAADTIMQTAAGQAFGAAIDGPSIQMFHLEVLRKY